MSPQFASSTLLRRSFAKRLLHNMLFTPLLPSAVHKLRTSILPKRLHEMHLHPILAAQPPSILAMSTEYWIGMSGFWSVEISFELLSSWGRLH